MRRPAQLAGAVLALLAACVAKDKPGGPGLPGGPTPPPRGRPTGLIASVVIGPAGGSLSLTASAGALTMAVPAGALAAAVTFSISEIVPVGLLGGVGSGYRIAPAGTPVALPVTLTFTPPSGTSPASVTPAYQPAVGYWYRSYTVTRDATTVSTPTTDLHDWSLATVAAQRDLSGPFRLDSTERLTHTATGNATLQYLGGNGTAASYSPQGMITLTTPVAKGAATCSTASASMALPDSVAESTPTRFDWGINGQWTLSCTDGSSDFVSTNFDSLGITSIGCARNYLGTPVIGPNLIQGTYKIDCGLDGAVTANWNLQGTACGQPCATPPNPCFAGVLQCGTGTATCANGTQLPAGTSCGTNLVCSPAGVCGACTAGATCTSTNACHTAGVVCSSGAPVCTDSGNVANGASCGANLVCSNGVCNACTQGTTCASTNPCDATATTECSSGSPVCTDRTFQPTGTSCGTNLVCSAAGACVACTAGAACTSTNQCHTAAISCSSSAPVCTDNGNVPNGTSCGAGMVCNGGLCNACVQGATCASTNPCDATATTECGLGVPICVDRTFKPAGTSCGINLTCSSAGVCGACTAGAACASTNPCDATATTECSSGAPVCTDRTFKPAGTTCGTNLVCTAAGACVNCTAGTACTSTNLCHAAAISCSSSVPVCTDTGNLLNGTSCGAGMVCNGGVCTACTAGAACVSATLCHAAAIVCGTGVPVCTDNGAIPNGTTCGTVAGMTCNAAACVASRTVTGTRMVTYWPDTGALPPVAAPDATVPLMNAIASGGGIYAGTFAAGGAFSIPNVPTGNYLLQFVDATGLMTFVDASASVLDLGYDALGRSGLVPPTGATPVTFTLSGLTAWSAGDQIQITSSNADVWDVLNTSAVAVGATSVSVPEGWFASTAAGRPLNLLAAADGLYLHQLHTGSFTVGTTPQSYRAASNTTSPALTGTALTDKTAATITGALSAAAQSGSITVNWSLSQFEPFLAQMNPAATTDGSAHSLIVGANAFPLTAAGPVAHGTPSLFVLQVPKLTGDLNSAPLSYGHLNTGIAPPWNEWRGVEFTGHVSYTAPSAGTVTITPLDERVSVGRREPMSPTMSTPIVPTLGPVQLPMLTPTAGTPTGAFSTLTRVGLTPSISWTAPAIGLPTSYTVEIYQLYVPATTTLSASVRVASWSTSNTSIALPAGVLAANNTYYARITANLVAPDNFATAPLRKINVYAWAGTLTGTFAP